MDVMTPDLVTAVFYTRAEARLAVGALSVMIGVDRGSVSLVCMDGMPGDAATRPDYPGGLNAGDIASRGFRSGSDPLCAEVLRRGDAVVLVRVDGGDTADLASGLLKRCGAAEIDVR